MQKIFKTGAIFWEKAQCVCAVVKTATQMALFYSQEKAVDQGAIPLHLRPSNPFVR